MRHCGTQEIVTEHLILRRFTPEDPEMMFGNWANDPEVTRFLRWDAHHTWAQSAEFINDAVQNYARDDFYLWGITQKSTGILLGSIAIVRAEEDPAPWTFNAAPLGEAWEPGYAIGRKWWNRGYMTEALAAVCDYWFKTTGSPWLRCCHADDNVASGAVLKKVGFVYDHDSTYHRFDGTPVPCRVYCCVRRPEPTHRRPPEQAPAAEPLPADFEQSIDEQHETADLFDITL